MSIRLLFTLALTVASLSLIGCAKPPMPDTTRPNDSGERRPPTATTSRQFPNPTNSDFVPPGEVQGYEDGEPIVLSIVRIDDKPVEERLAVVYRKMRSAAERDGVHLRIVSGFRTMAHQRVLYQDYLAHRGPPADPPGRSKHQSGRALDLNTRLGHGVAHWLRQNAWRYGFRRTVPSEPWHWEWQPPPFPSR